jgi:hypothetical protein
VRSGSIIPIKLHARKLTLSRAYNLPLRLDIYLSPAQKASGLLYMDDGISIESKYVYLRYSFTEFGKLLVEKIGNTQEYMEEIQGMKIKDIRVIGWKGQTMKSVEVMRQGTKIVKLGEAQREGLGFGAWWKSSNKVLEILNVNLPIDDGRMFSENQSDVKLI